MTVIASLALPPPVQGHAVVSEAILAELRKICSNLIVIDTSPRISDKTKPRYHLNRISSVFCTAWALIRHSLDAEKTIYTVYESGLGIVYNFLTVALARALNFRIFLHHHTSAHTLAKSAGFSMLALLAGGGTSHVVLSEEMASDLRRNYRSVGRVFVSGNACYVEDPSGVPSRTQLAGTCRIGILSNLTFEKGLKIAIDAAFEARKIGLNIILVVAGPALGRQAASAIEIARAEAPELFEVLGQVRGIRKDEYFKSINIFLFPSIYQFEAQPLVLLEAMSYGLPVISTDVGYTKELADSNSSFMIPTSSDISGQIVKRVSTLISSPSIYVSECLFARTRYLVLRKASEDQLSSLCKIIASNSR